MIPSGISDFRQTDFREYKMKKSIFLSSLTIALVIALTAAVTWAYFSGTKDESATITTATISIDGTWNFPLQFLNMLPGETKSQEVAVANGGSREADFYVQMLSTSGGTNFCQPNDYLDLVIQEINGWGGGWVANWYSGSICPLYPGWSGSTIPKVGNDVPAGGVRYYRVSLTLDPAADNSYQGASNTDTVHLIAVQYNGPAPVPDKQGGTTQDPWPADTTAPDDDPNYP